MITRDLKVAKMLLRYLLPYTKMFSSGRTEVGGGGSAEDDYS